MTGRTRGSFLATRAYHPTMTSTAAGYPLAILLAELLSLHRRRVDNAPGPAPRSVRWQRSTGRVKVLRAARGGLRVRRIKTSCA